MAAPPGSESEIAFISGVASTATVAAISYGSWSAAGAPVPPVPIIYDPTFSFTTKWGSTTLLPAGAPASNVSFSFDIASNWQPIEIDQWLSALSLWSAVADITFTFEPNQALADFILYFQPNQPNPAGGTYQQFPNLQASTIGSNVVSPPGAGAFITIGDDTAPLDGSFETRGGDSYFALVHELGHLIGLGHGGPYNANADPATQQLGIYDTQLWAIMSYIRPDDQNALYFNQYPAEVRDTDWGISADGVPRWPTTPMMLDILAAQRLYGIPTSGPLVGGNHVFGFNTNIDDSIRRYFDFTDNRSPVITIWDGGLNNTLDLSGWSTPSRIDLEPGSFSSANGQVNNIAIASDTVIETAIGGGGRDRIAGNSQANFLFGNADNDTLEGGAGNDILDGGSGVDTALFSGLLAAYSLTDLGSGSLRVVGPDGTDMLSSIERLEFLDVTVGWPPVAVTGPVGISAAGDFDGDGTRGYAWRNAGAVMTLWDYNGTAQQVTAADLGPVGFSWNILAGAHFSNVPSATTDQMLARNVADGDMSLWWVTGGQRVGVSIGQHWNGRDYIASGQFTDNGGAGIANFLVTNVGDDHLYDWWIDSNNQLQGTDLGPVWSDKSFIGSGDFTPNGRTDFLVANAVDHHLYDWWIDPVSSKLQGVDLGAAWNNVEYLASGNFTANGGDDFLVFNTGDHHLYDWWIDPASHTLQGIDLGAAWNNVELLASGHFSDHTTGDQFLVRNTVDHHLYEWWIDPVSRTLQGLDLGPAWNSNLQIVDSRDFNNANGANNELLVRNSADGHFYEWWIANNQLQGTNLGNALDIL